MNNRFEKLGIVVVLGAFLAASCSGPAPKPASTVTSDAADEKDETREAPAVKETPKPRAAERKEPVQKAAAKPAPKPAPAVVAKAAPPVSSPAPVSAPVPAPAVPVAAAPAPVATAPTPVPTPLPVASAPVPVAVAVAPSAPPAPTTRDVVIPSGTLIAIRMIDAVDSKSDHVGQTFKASLDSPVIVDGQTVISKGGDVFVKLAKVQSAGSLSGTSEIQLQLDRVYIGNKSYTVTSNVFQSTGASQGQKAVKQTGIGAGVGAIIGAIAGGKKGAAIGAGVGGGVGAAGTAIEKSEQVRVESESKVTFRLEQPLNVTIPVGGAAGASSGRSVPLGGGR